MKPKDIKETDIGEGEGDETPVCINCFNPVDPLAHYCPNCGEATGQFTQYIPFVNIRWQVRVWGKIWRQVFSRDVSIAGRIFRMLMIIWKVPIMLVGLLFIFNKKSKKENMDSA